MYVCMNMYISNYNVQIFIIMYTKQLLLLQDTILMLAKIQLMLE